MLLMTQQEILDLYQSGGFIGQSVASDWWRYLSNHRPGLAWMIESSVPEQMLQDGVIEVERRDLSAWLTVYKLVTTEVTNGR